MPRKHFEPRSALKSVKPERPLPPRKAGALIGPWLTLANLLPPLDDPPEVRAVWSRIRKLAGSRKLAKGVPVRNLRRVLGRMPSQWLEEPAKLKSSLPTATDFMKRPKAAGVANLVKLRRGTEEEALLDLAQQVYFVLVGLVSRPRRTSLTWVRVTYEIDPQRSGFAVRAWNPFTRFTEAIASVETKRLRRCTVCNQFFYAANKNASCCSRNCSHTLRQHRFAGNWEQ